jgi:hypothetical protein
MKKITPIIIWILNGSRPKGVTYERKIGGNQEIYIPVSKDIKKSEVTFAQRVHPADQLPPEIRSNPLKRQAGHGSLGRQRGGEAQTGPPPAKENRSILMMSSPLSLVYIGEDPHTPYAAADGVPRQMAGLSYPDGNSGKAYKDKPGVHRPLLQKRQRHLRLKGKSLTKPRYSLKSRIPIRTSYTGKERKTCGFRHIDTAHHGEQTTLGHEVHTLTATDIASYWLKLRPLCNNVHTWTSWT